MKKNNQSPKTILLSDYQVPAFLVDKVELNFTLDPKCTQVRSILKMRRNPEATHTDNCWLDGEAIDLLEAKLDGKLLDKSNYECSDSGLEIKSVPDCFTLEITNTCAPIENKALSGLYVSNGMFCTQCEAQGFRRITFYPDRPDVMSTFKVTICADKKSYPVLLSNGNAKEAKDLPDGRHQVTWEDPFKKPSYLFALVAGDLACVEDKYTTGSGREVKIAFYVESRDIKRCDHAIASLKNAMRWDEETYGLEYDLDIYMVVAVSDFNMGAMENKGLNIFNTKYVLADPNTATDFDYQLVEAVIGHEYFHNWTGNRVTCRDWFQLSLKEGLTVFREQQFSAAMGSEAVKRIEDANIIRTRQFAEDSGPLSHPIRPDSFIEINNFYTLTIYNKGAEVIRMLHTLLGETGFRRGMDLYFKRHDGQAVTTENFVSAMSDANSIDLKQFQRWYNQAGTPLVRVESHYNADKKHYRLILSQHFTPAPGDKTPKEPLMMPIQVELLSQSGKVLHPSVVLTLKDEKQHYLFDGIAESPIVSVLGGFSAPVKLDYSLNNTQQGVILRSASDPYNRWAAAQALYRSAIEHLLKQKQQGKGPLLDGEIFSDFETLLLDSEITDPALTAQLLAFPSFSYLMQQCGPVSIALLVEIYAYFKKAFSSHLSNSAEECYKKMIGQDGAGFRQLKNTCLSLWVASGKKEAIQACVQQYHEAKNMTDRYGALQAINHQAVPERQVLLEAFYESFKNYPLVIDKWFALQAHSMCHDTLDAVKALLNHKDFSLENPNKVYALLNSFATQNWPHFHNENGKGYELLMDNILKIDTFNPQVAARLASAYANCSFLEEKQQQKVKAVLESGLSASKHSADLFEVLDKTLSAINA